jgi:hypothetical protein
MGHGAAACVDDGDPAWIGRRDLEETPSGHPAAP